MFNIKYVAKFYKPGHLLETDLSSPPVPRNFRCSYGFFWFCSEHRILTSQMMLSAHKMIFYFVDRIHFFGLKYCTRIPSLQFVLCCCGQFNRFSPMHTYKLLKLMGNCGSDLPFEGMWRCVFLSNVFVVAMYLVVIIRCCVLMCTDISVKFMFVTLVCFPNMLNINKQNMCIL